MGYTGTKAYLDNHQIKSNAASIIRHLREAEPDCEMTFLCQEELQELVDLLAKDWYICANECPELDRIA
jgi:hypothetical protein